MREWALDLHIHSALSPCCSKEMLPGPVLRKARDLGLQAIAVTDHNAAGNTAAFLAVGRELGIKVFPGMELQTAEDIHLLCLFEELEKLLRFEELVWQSLPPLMNKKESLGEQWLVNAAGEKTGELERLLLVGTSLTLEESLDQVHRLGGLCLAAHLDRQAFSLWGHLGALPHDLDLDGVELTPHLPRDPLLVQAIKDRGFSYLISSDAHYLADLRSPQCFAFLEELNLGELKLALKGQAGRKIRTIR